MPGHGRRFEFIGREPIVFRVALALFLVNMLLGLVWSFLPDQFAVRSWHVAVWYAAHWPVIEIVLALAIVIILVVFRKDIRHVDRTKFRSS
jgi:hypothetical protein